MPFIYISVCISMSFCMNSYQAIPNLSASGQMLKCTSDGLEILFMKFPTIPYSYRTQ